MPKIVKASATIVRHTPDVYDAIEEAGRICYASEPKDTPELRDTFLKEQPKAKGLALEMQTTAFRWWQQERFLRDKIRMGHHTLLEHASVTVDFIGNRGFTHEEVRHRPPVFSQESTRYCNYSGDKFGTEITVIDPQALNFDPEAPTDTLVDLPQDMTTGNGCKRLSIRYVGHQDAWLNKFDVWWLCMQVAEWGYLALLKLGAAPQEARDVLPQALKAKLRQTCNLREWHLIFGQRFLGLTGTPHPQMRELMKPLFIQFYGNWPVLFEDQHEEAVARGLL